MRTLIDLGFLICAVAATFMAYAALTADPSIRHRMDDMVPHVSIQVGR